MNNVNRFLITLTLAVTGASTSFAEKPAKAAGVEKSPAPAPKTAGPASGAVAAPGGGEFEKKLAELQGIQGQLGQIRTKAMEKPKIKKDFGAFEKMLKTEMRKSNPALTKDMDRFEKLDKDFKKAQSKKDDATQQKLLPELQELARKLSQAQRTAMQSAKISTQAEKLQKQLESEMAKIDPNTTKLIDRMKVIVGELRSMSGQPQMSTP